MGFWWLGLRAVEALTGRNYDIIPVGNIAPYVADAMRVVTERTQAFSDLIPPETGTTRSPRLVEDLHKCGSSGWPESSSGFDGGLAAAVHLQR